MRKKLLGLLLLVPFVCSCGNKQLVETCDYNPRCSGCLSSKEVEKARIESKYTAYSFIGYLNVYGHQHRLYYKR